MRKNIPISLITIVIVFWVLVVSVQAKQPESPVNIQLIDVPGEIPLGAKTTIELVITPTETITDFHASFSDVHAWAWVQEFQPPKVISTTTVLTALIAPENLGNLTPSLLIDYSANGNPLREYVEANNALDVKAVSEFVSFDITTKSGTVKQMDKVKFNINVVNHSPFSLTVNKISGNGIDLEWSQYSDKTQIGPGEDQINLLAQVQGEHPQPQLSISYSWVDAVGKTGDARINIIGREINYLSGLKVFSQVPVEVWGIIIGIVAGSLSLLANDWVTRQVQKGVNCRQVSGMLQMAIMEAEHAAVHGTEVGLDLLEEVIKKEGFFQITRHFDLVDDVRGLWNEASKYNKSLNSPGNIQREKDLRKAIDNLNKSVGRISLGWMRYTWIRLFKK